MRGPELGEGAIPSRAGRRRRRECLGHAEGRGEKALRELVCGGVIVLAHGALPSAKVCRAAPAAPSPSRARRKGHYLSFPRRGGRKAPERAGPVFRGQLLPLPAPEDGRNRHLSGAAQRISCSHPSPSACSKIRFVSVWATAGCPVVCEDELAQLSGVARHDVQQEVVRARHVEQAQHAGQARRGTPEGLDLFARVLDEPDRDEGLTVAPQRERVEIDPVATDHAAGLEPAQAQRHRRLRDAQRRGERRPRRAGRSRSGPQQRAGPSGRVQGPAPWAPSPSGGKILRPSLSMDRHPPGVIADRAVSVVPRHGSPSPSPRHPRRPRRDAGPARKRRSRPRPSTSRPRTRCPMSIRRARVRRARNRARPRPGSQRGVPAACGSRGSRGSRTRSPTSSTPRVPSPSRAAWRRWLPA